MANAKTSSKKNVIAIKDPDISEQISALREDVALLATALKVQSKSTLSEKTADVKGTLTETLETLKTATSEKTDTAKKAYKDITQTAETSIKENPITSVALSVGAGLLLGAILRR